MRLNDKAWNTRANLLYFETPAGVGFSRGPVNSSDELVTKDNINALREFYARFPQLRKNDLYLAGEGYAGIYVPLLALKIHQDNQNDMFPIKIKLKGSFINNSGILVGNPCT
jgi:carboxypeptidase C (cathepsin A)